MKNPIQQSVQGVDNGKNAPAFSNVDGLIKLHQETKDFIRKQKNELTHTINQAAISIENRKAYIKAYQEVVDRADADDQKAYAQQQIDMQYQLITETQNTLDQARQKKMLIEENEQKLDQEVEKDLQYQQAIGKAVFNPFSKVMQVAQEIFAGWQSPSATGGDKTSSPAPDPRNPQRMWDLVNDPATHGKVQVEGYTRDDGTQVAAHSRAAPDDSVANNLSFKREE